MKYILDGNEKDVTNVIKEQRVRMGRGVISLTPISKCGLITKEDARKAMDEKLTELTASVEENESLKSQISGFVENPLKVAPLIQSNLTPVKFFHSFILFILVFFVFFLSVMPGSTLNFVYKYNDSFLLLHLRSDSPKSSIRIA